MSGDDTTVADPPHRAGWGLLSWSVIALLAVLVYEVTTQPILAGLTVSTKIGWDDFRTALWLRRKDRNSRRGRAHFWLYFAWGLAKISALGLGIGIVLAMVAINLNPPAVKPAAPAPPNELMKVSVGATFAFLLGLVFAPLAGLLAIWHGCRGRVKLWLSIGVHVAREKSIWPPYYGTKNYAGIVVIVTAVAVALACFTAIGFVIAPLMAQANRQLFTLLFCVSLLGLIVIALSVRDRLVRALVAESPYDVWDEDTDDEPIADGLSE